MADSTSEADTVVLWKTILTPFSQLCVDVDNFSYDPKVIKSKYRKWLKGHHPDKKKICEEEDIFLRVYSKFFKDLPAEENFFWKTLLEIECIVKAIDSCENEELLRTSRRDLRTLEQVLDPKIYPALYKTCIKDAMQYISGKIYQLIGAICKKHHPARRCFLQSKCIDCKEEKGILTRCEIHSTLLKRVHKEFCRRCKIDLLVENSDEELPDLHELFNEGSFTRVKQEKGDKVKENYDEEEENTKHDDDKEEDEIRCDYEEQDMANKYDGDDEEEKEKEEEEENNADNDDNVEDKLKDDDEEEDKVKQDEDGDEDKDEYKVKKDAEKEEDKGKQYDDEKEDKVKHDDDKKAKQYDVDKNDEVKHDPDDKNDKANVDEEENKVKEDDGLDKVKHDDDIDDEENYVTQEDVADDKNKVKQDNDQEDKDKVKQEDADNEQDKAKQDDVDYDKAKQDDDDNDNESNWNQDDDDKEEDTVKQANDDSNDDKDKVKQVNGDDADNKDDKEADKVKQDDDIDEEEDKVKKDDDDNDDNKKDDKVKQEDKVKQANDYDNNDKEEDKVKQDSDDDKGKDKVKQDDDNDEDDDDEENEYKFRAKYDGGDEDDDDVDVEQPSEGENSDAQRKKLDMSILHVNEPVPELIVSGECNLCENGNYIKPNLRPRHISYHTNYITTTEFKVLLCRKNCNGKKVSHFHCPYCRTTINRRIDAKQHFDFLKCKNPSVVKRIKKPIDERKLDHEESLDKKMHDHEESIDKTTQHDHGESLDKRMHDHKESIDKTTQHNHEESLDKRMHDHKESIDKTTQDDHEESLDKRMHDHEESIDKRTQHDHEESLDETMNDHEESIDKRAYHVSIMGMNEREFCFPLDDTNMYKCKLCPENILISPKQVKRHTSIHKSNFLITNNKTVFLCKQTCRASKHYHCPYCSKTIMRKCDADKHLRKCSTKKEEKEKETVIIPPKINRELYTARKAKRERTRIKCQQCDMEVFSWNLMTHIRNMHTKKSELITKNNYLASVCVDRNQGIYLVQSGTPGVDVPVHAQKKVIYSRGSHINCENKDCRRYNESSIRTNKPDFECKHVQSISYNVHNAQAISLKENEILKKILKKETIREIKENRNIAKADGTNLVFLAEFENDTRRLHFSVFDSNNHHCYSQMNRVRVTYDKVENVWYCVCCSNRSCIHKYTCKWATLTVYPHIFDANTGEASIQNEHNTSEAKNVSGDNTQLITNMINYHMKKKSIPEKIPQHIINRSREQNFPYVLHPSETICCSCDSENLTEDLITSNAVIVTKSGVVNNIKIFQKKCISCDMVFNYQEYSDGLHNFDNHLVLSIELCMHLRSMLSNNTSISRVVESIESEYECVIPHSRSILDAYLHFESLCEHSYDFNCYQCGKYPVSLCADGNKKTVFSLSVNDIPPVPEDYNGDVNCEDFWQDVSLEILSRAYLKGSSELKLKPTFNYWAGWIGRETRKSDVILNTENIKISAEAKCKKQSDGSVDELTDEYLQDVLLSKPENDVKKVCKEFGLSCAGTKAEMVDRLKRKSNVPDIYKKMLTKIRGHTGGWITLVCEHGVVYAVKFVLRAESVRDYSDLLKCFKHFPNIVCSDLAPRLAVHTNLRFPETLPFHPNAGSFAEVTDPNIALAKKHKLSRTFPWLVEKKKKPDENGHPITGCSDHYSCLDALHEGNYASTFWQF